ncbi:hypothetical protein V6N13_088596 [Hibiscus sabdariffa]
MEGNGLEEVGSNEKSLGKCLSGLVDDGNTESHLYYLSRRCSRPEAMSYPTLKFVGKVELIDHHVNEISVSLLA